MRPILLTTFLLIVALAAWLSGGNELHAATVGSLQAQALPATSTLLQEHPAGWAQAGSALLFIAAVIWRNSRLSR